MRSIKRDLEDQRSVLTSAIKSLGSNRTADHGREIVKDPYGTASITHDDEVSFAVADSRARQLAEVTRALEDYNAGRYGICRECGAAQGHAVRHALRGVSASAGRARPRRVTSAR